MLYTRVVIACVPGYKKELPALRRLRHEDCCKFKPYLGYIANGLNKMNNKSGHGKERMGDEGWRKPH